MTDTTAKVVIQELTSDGIITTYSNGDIQLLPYLVDENGEKYVELFHENISIH